MFVLKPSPLFTYLHPVTPKIDGLPNGTSSSRVCCVVGGCFHDVVVMCSEFMGHRTSLRNQMELWGCKHIGVVAVSEENPFLTVLDSSG